MAYIRQEDITNGTIALTKVSSFSITTTVSYFNSFVTANQGTLEVSTGFAATQPLQIKVSGNDNQGWEEEQDWTLYSVTYSPLIPYQSSTAAASTRTSITTVISNVPQVGDLVAVYGFGTWSAGPTLPVNSFSYYIAGSVQASLLWTDGDGQFFGNGSAWYGTDNYYMLGYPLPLFGTQNACGQIASGGTTFAYFNGWEWTVGPSVNFGRSSCPTYGSLNAAMIVAGNVSNTQVVRTGEVYNGTAWQVMSVLVSRTVSPFAVGSGSQNAAWLQGSSSDTISNTQFFNGSIWTQGPCLTLSKQAPTAIGGINNGMANGGADGSNNSTTTTELLNGSVWYLNTSMAVARYGVGYVGGSGTAAAGQMVGDGNSGFTSEFHIQNTYRKLTSQFLSEAKNIGIAHNINGVTTQCSVKLFGYVDNIAVTSGNVAITAGNWVAGYFAVAPRFNSIIPASGANCTPTTIVIKSQVEPEDLVIARVMSRTQMQVFSPNMFGKYNLGNW